MAACQDTRLGSVSEWQDMRLTSVAECQDTSVAVWQDTN